MTQFELILALCCLAEGVLILVQAIQNKMLKQDINSSYTTFRKWAAHYQSIIDRLQSELSHFPKRGKKGKFEGRGKK